MNKLLVISLLALTACTTPKTIMRNDAGQVQICGGNVSSSMAGGAIGYHIQRGVDADCVKDLEAQGFKPVPGKRKVAG
jgi:hypothetical protein